MSNPTESSPLPPSRTLPATNSSFALPAFSTPPPSAAAHLPPSTKSSPDSFTHLLDGHHEQSSLIENPSITPSTSVPTRLPTSRLSPSLRTPTTPYTALATTLKPLSDILTTSYDPSTTSSDILLGFLLTLSNEIELSLLEGPRTSLVLLRIFVDQCIKLNEEINDRLGSGLPFSHNPRITVVDVLSWRLEEEEARLETCWINERARALVSEAIDYVEGRLEEYDVERAVSDEVEAELVRVREIKREEARIKRREEEVEKRKDMWGRLFYMQEWYHEHGGGWD